MRIFAAGVATESNTFCPIPTTLDDFAVARADITSKRGRDGTTFDLGEVWGRQAQVRGHEFIESLMAWAEPSGITVRSAYETLRDEMLDDLDAAMPVDVVLLMLHGAMIAQGYDDCEQDMICRVRDIVGPDCVIGVELDLHCNLHAKKIAAADIVVTYKEYPHVDINDRANELFKLAVDAKLKKIRPTMALFDCRMIGSYPTTREPLRGFVKAMMCAEGRDGILSVSFAHGFRSADVPHLGAKLLVVTDNDGSSAEKIAREFGLQVYGLRRQIGFESISLSMECALSEALCSEMTPVVVADQSDNTGGGAPGDATFALRWLLDHHAQDVALAMFFDPQVVGIAQKAGVGATLPLRIGGKLGASSGEPVDLEVTVLSQARGYMQPRPQQSGKSLFYPAGDVVALRSGTIDVVVSSLRCQCYSPALFTDLDIDPTRKRVLVLKSNQHFYAGFEPIAGRVLYMAAPGAVPPDPRVIPYRRAETGRLYPWVENPLGI